MADHPNAVRGDIRCGRVSQRSPVTYPGDWVAQPRGFCVRPLSARRPSPSARCRLEVVGEFGRGGRQLGPFLRPHGMSIDSKGNLYVGEASTGRRVQRFNVSGGR